MSFFKGIKDVKASRDSVYLRAGRYLTYMDNFKQFKNRKGHERIAFEMTVVQVLDESKAFADSSGPHRMGDKVSWVPTDDEAEIPRVKSAIKVICGVEEDLIDEEFCTNLATESQPLRGLFVEWDCEMIKTSKGNPFTVRKAVRKWGKQEVEEKVPASVLAGLKINASLA